MVERRKKPMFVRKDWYKAFRLGGTKKKAVWRRARGRHSKIRQKWKNRQKAPSIGYGMPREIRGLIKGMKPIMINNLDDLSKIGKNEIGILSGKMGNKKRLEVAKKAVSMNIKFSNFNAQKFMDEMGKKMESKKPVKETKK